MNVEIRIGDVVEAHAPFGCRREGRDRLRAEQQGEEDDAVPPSSPEPIRQWQPPAVSQSLFSTRAWRAPSVTLLTCEPLKVV